METYKYVIIRNHTFEVSYNLGNDTYQSVELPIQLAESFLFTFGDRRPSREEFVQWKQNENNKGIDPHANYQQGQKPKNTNIDTSQSSIEKIVSHPIDVTTSIYCE